MAKLNENERKQIIKEYEIFYDSAIDNEATSNEREENLSHCNSIERILNILGYKILFDEETAEFKILENN